MNSNPKVLVVSNNTTPEILWSPGLHENNIDLVIQPNQEKNLYRSGEKAPNLIIIDDNDQGPAILNTIKMHRKDSPIPILLLTRNNQEEYILRAYDAGADECIIKPISPLLFHSKLKAWLRRSSAATEYSPVPLKVGKVTLIPSERAVVIDDGRPIHLTYLELRLIYLLMGRPGRTVSGEELILGLWGYDRAADTTGLKNAVYRLRKKIEMDPLSPLIIRTVTSVGYKMVCE